MDCVNFTCNTNSNNVKIKMMDKSKTVILGSGVSGIGAVKLAQEKGLEIFLSDSKNIKSETKKLLSKLEVKYEESGHTENLIKDSN